MILMPISIIKNTMLFCKTTLSLFADIIVSYTSTKNTALKKANMKPMLQNNVSNFQIWVGCSVTILMPREDLITRKSPSIVIPKIVFDLSYHSLLNELYESFNLWSHSNNCILIVPVAVQYRSRLIKWQNPPIPCRYIHKLSRRAIDTFCSNDLCCNNLRNDT